MSQDKVESRTEQIRRLVVEYLEGMRLFSGENSNIPEKQMNFSLDVAISELCLPDDPNAQGTRGLLKQLDELLAAARPSVPAQGQADTLVNDICEAYEQTGGRGVAEILKRNGIEPYALAASRSEAQPPHPCPNCGRTIMFIPETNSWVHDRDASHPFRLHYCDTGAPAAGSAERQDELAAIVGNFLGAWEGSDPFAIYWKAVFRRALTGTDTDVAKEKL